MRIFHATYTSKGETKTCQGFTVSFYDRNGRERRWGAGRHRAVAELAARMLLRLDSMAEAGLVPDAPIVDWISRLPPRKVNLLQRWGLISTERTAALAPIKEHVDRWLETVAFEGASDRHVAQTKKRVDRLLKEASASRWSSITTTAITRALGRLKSEGAGREPKPLSARTQGYYVQALRQFCRWMVREGFASSDPLVSLGKPTSSQDFERRALTEEEIRALILSVDGERALLYRLATETGFRKGELRALQVQHLHLAETGNAWVEIPGAKTKNKKKARLPLLASTAELLHEHTKGQRPEAAVLALPRWFKFAVHLRADLEAVGVDVADHVAGRVDFHCLRVSFVTRLADLGVDLHTLQGMARHEDYKTTNRHYVKLQDSKKRAALELLPPLDGDKKRQDTRQAQSSEQ